MNDARPVLGNGIGKESYGPVPLHRGEEAGCEPEAAADEAHQDQHGPEHSRVGQHGRDDEECDEAHRRDAAAAGAAELARDGVPPPVAFYPSRLHDPWAMDDVDPCRCIQTKSSRSPSHGSNCRRMNPSGIVRRKVVDAGATASGTRV